MNRSRTLKHIISILKNRKVYIEQLTDILPEEFSYLDRMIKLLIEKYENNELIDVSEISSHDSSLLSDKNFN
tara:strand:+ start:54 stop:269 length:216 start_codon:yes stop_codon:yes gene_type:complete